jgi:hypothetical protein
MKGMKAMTIPADKYINNQIDALSICGDAHHHSAICRNSAPKW